MRERFAPQVQLLLATMLTSACSLAAEPLSGQVLDRVTKQPIAGVIVVRHSFTTSANFASSRTWCSHVESAVSDATGHYHLPPVTGKPQAESWAIHGYKPGYEEARGPRYYSGRPIHLWDVYEIDPPQKLVGTFWSKDEAIAATHPENVYLKPRTGTPDERFEYLQRSVFGGMDCTFAGTSKRNQYPLLRAAYQEAKPLATTPKQEHDLNWMRDQAARSWLASPLRSSDIGPSPAYPDEIVRELDLDQIPPKGPKQVTIRKSPSGAREVMPPTGPGNLGGR